MTDRALLVGIDEYPDPVNNLNSCVADTYAFQDLLGQLGFEDSGIRLLHNASATLAAVQDGLEWLTDGAEEGDRLVFFQSSHGYRYLEGDVMTEVLCTYDQFLKDRTLADLTSELPRGVLTVVIDACHSGGMDKEWGLRVKAFTPPREALLTKAMSLTRRHGLKPFGRAFLLEEADSPWSAAGPPSKAAAKGIVPGANELNALLLTACEPDETAAAGSARTQWLSAFTYALVTEMDTSISVSDLRDRSTALLKSLKIRQTPCVFAPSFEQYLLDETFISRQQAKAMKMIREVEEMLKEMTHSGGGKYPGGFSAEKTQTTEVTGMTTTAEYEKIDEVLEKLFAGIKTTKGKAPAAGNAAWQADARMLASVLAPGMAAAMPTDKSLAVRPTVTDPDNLDDKSLWSVATSLARVVVPTLIDELTKTYGPAKGTKAPDLDDVQQVIADAVPPSRAGDQKFFGVLESVIGIAAPLIISAVSKDFKIDHRAPTGTFDIELPEDVDPKFWGDVFDVVRTTLPYVVRAIA
ncbi:caspase family protein [Streptomyces sp. NPDC006385]|uniref:caspase family protein n=1 Tax=Streptomyces sp. NPDC006385 TaxID=3156761 RepID=UPI0033BC2C93